VEAIAKYRQAREQEVTACLSFSSLSQTDWRGETVTLGLLAECLFRCHVSACVSHP